MPGTERTLRAEAIGDPQRALALADEWRPLAEERGNAFVTPEWFRAAAEVYGESAAPLAVAVREDSGALAGILPLAIDLSGRPRALRFAGSGLGDHFHPACAIEDEELVAAAAGEALSEVSAKWSAIVLENVLADATWPEALRAGAPARLAAVAGRPAVLPYTETGGASWEEYLAGRSRSFRNQVGRKLRKLEREHEVRFRSAAGPGEAGRDLETLFDLHRRRWDEREGASSLTESAIEFHRRFAAACAERGWLRLYVMEIDGDAAAAFYGWSLGGRFSYYQAGLNPGHSRHSAGFLLLAHAMRSAFEEGASSFELLLGDEPFKARFAAAEREATTLTLVRAAHPARAAIAGDAALRATGRRLPEPLKRPARAVARALGGALPGSRRR